MPLSISLIEEEKAVPINSYEDLGRIIHSIMNREIEMLALPPAAVKRLPPMEHMGLTKLRPIIRTEGLLLDTDVEFFWTMGLSADMHVAFVDLVAMGSLASANVGPSEAFRGFTVYPALQAVFAHNHPSGNLSPSDFDMKTAKMLIRAGMLLKRPVFDHIIINREGGVFSFQHEKLLERLQKAAVREERTAEEAAQETALYETILANERKRSAAAREAGAKALESLKAKRGELKAKQEELKAKREELKERKAELAAKDEALLKAAAAMLQAGVPLERAAEVTGLTAAKLKKL